ncbi:MAG TPA: DMT family transporter [bacterium]|nr:DMT family transporter [bacterium]
MEKNTVKEPGGTTSKGLLLILLAAVLFSLMAMCTKLSARAGVPHGEITFMRFASGFITVGVFALLGVVKIEPEEKKWLYLRGVLGSAAMVCYFFALSNGTMKNSVLLNSSYPVFIVLFSSLFIGEKVRGYVYPLLVVSLVGIALVIKPQPGHVEPADVMALVSAVLAGLAILVLRRARYRNNTWTILLYLNGIGMFVVGGFVIADPVWPAPAAWLPILGVCFFANAAQMVLTYAYKYARASDGGVVIMSQVVFSTLIGYFLFSERIDAVFIIGAVLVLGCGGALTLLASEHRQPADVAVNKQG